MATTNSIAALMDTTARADNDGTTARADNDSTTANSSLVSSTTTALYQNLTDVVTEAVTSTTDHSPGADHPRTLKDNTTFVAGIVVGVVIPAIFIIVFILICRQRRKDLQARRTQMLLQTTQDFALEDYTILDRASGPPPRP